MPSSWNEKANDVLGPLFESAETYKTFENTHWRGVPVMHEDLNCTIHIEDPQCQHKVMASSPMVGAGHHARAKTNVPVIGVLTQPIPESNEAWNAQVDKILENSEQEYPRKHFIEATHVKFLESAGARVVPIYYDQATGQLERELDQVNGLYIPGDFKDLVGHGNFEYTRAVRRALLWAQEHQEKESKHFPILGIGYGMISMIKSQMKDNAPLEHFDAQGGFAINLLQEPENTYIFDMYIKDELEAYLDKVRMFSDIELGIDVEHFVKHERELGNYFVPIATFDNSEALSQNEEKVAVMEGVIYPWFGVGYRLDRVQFSMAQGNNDLIDHSKDAIMLAQKVANLFVDEARLSVNKYTYIINEVEAVGKISNQNPHLVDIPLIQSFPDHTIKTDIYLF